MFDYGLSEDGSEDFFHIISQYIYRKLFTRYYHEPFLDSIMGQQFPIVNKRQSFATSPEKVKDLKINSEVTKHETKSHKYTIFSKDTTRVPSRIVALRPTGKLSVNAKIFHFGNKHVFLTLFFLRDPAQ